MRLAQPISEDGQALTYNTLTVPGCNNTTVGFDLLGSEPTVSSRRYCNKILVHECVSVPISSPLVLTKVEFVATDDSLYTEFNIFKTSEASEDMDATIELQPDPDDNTKTAGILVNFIVNETCCQPPRMAYKLYGYTDDTTKVLLARGNLFISPCGCPDDVLPTTFIGIQW
jgi:hypothetical protein